MQPEQQDCAAATGWRSVALQPDGKIVVARACADQSSNFCVNRYHGGVQEYRECSLDIDGDRKILVTTDSLIHARIALGITGEAVVGGITFPTNATRKRWSEIRRYLITQCGASIP